MSNKRTFNTEEAKAIGAALGLNWGQVDVEQFRRGLEVELEHGARDPETNVTNDDLTVTGKIAWAHLKELPDYYTRLDELESQADAASSKSLHGDSLQASLTVRDLEKSVAWYVDVFGFVVERRIEGEGRLHAVAVSAGKVRILLHQDDGAKGWDRVKGEGFSLQITTTQDVDEIARRIKEQGGTLQLDPTDMPWGARIFRLLDPDGFRWSVSGAK